MEREKIVAKKNMKLVEMGRTGLTRFGGYISEEWLPELQGRKGAEVYRKMADSDAIIGGYLFAIKEIAKSVPWFAVPANSSEEGQEGRQVSGELHLRHVHALALHPG